MRAIPTPRSLRNCTTCCKRSSARTRRSRKRVKRWYSSAKSARPSRWCHRPCPRRSAQRAEEEVVLMLTTCSRSGTPPYRPSANRRSSRPRRRKPLARRPSARSTSTQEGPKKAGEGRRRRPKKAEPKRRRRQRSTTAPQPEVPARGPTEAGTPTSPPEGSGRTGDHSGQRAEARRPEDRWARSNCRKERERNRPSDTERGRRKRIVKPGPVNIDRAVQTRTAAQARVVPVNWTRMP